MSGRLADWLLREPYQAYSYSYPHKSAYRKLDPPVVLSDLWAAEARDALFLYLHIPFCTYRCGFCNLFALSSPGEDRVQAYLEQLQRQLRVTAESLGAHRFARLAIGGGTPSYLSAGQLEQLFAMINRYANIDLAHIPSGIEVSPETVDRERMRVCRDAGIDRVSMGVQSFSDIEVRALVRPQQRDVVARAIGAIREQGFPMLNLDLIYGIAGQSCASFVASIESALTFRPEEIYLYPLYVRPRTGLARIAAKPGRQGFAIQSEPVDQRLSMYLAGRNVLLAHGYEQVSMRMFRAPETPQVDAPAYSCQSDGMVGIGCGARSYTQAVHYSSEYAVERRGVSDILDAYLQRSEHDFSRIVHGIRLDQGEQRRRHVMQSLLNIAGLDHSGYRSRFGSDCFSDLPQLHELLECGLAENSDELFVLNANGMARADTIGPWLASAAVEAAMRDGEDA